MPGSIRVAASYRPRRTRPTPVISSCRTDASTNIVGSERDFKRSATLSPYSDLVERGGCGVGDCHFCVREMLQCFLTQDPLRLAPNGILNSIALRTCMISLAIRNSAQCLHDGFTNTQKNPPYSNDTGWQT